MRLRPTFAALAGFVTVAVLAGGGCTGSSSLRSNPVTPRTEAGLIASAQALSEAMLRGDTTTVYRYLSRSCVTGKDGALLATLLATARDNDDRPGATITVRARRVHGSLGEVKTHTEYSGTAMNGTSDVGWDPYRYAGGRWQLDCERGNRAGADTPESDSP